MPKLARRLATAFLSNEGKRWEGDLRPSHGRLDAILHASHGSPRERRRDPARANHGMSSHVTVSVYQGKRRGKMRLCSRAMYGSRGRLHHTGSREGKDEDHGPEEEGAAKPDEAEKHRHLAEGHLAHHALEQDLKQRRD